MATTKRFLKDLGQLPDADLAAAQAVVDALPALFGQPHLHSSASIQKLKDDWFECRAGLQWRLVFKRVNRVLVFHMAGNHDDVRRFLRNL